MDCDTTVEAAVDAALNTPKATPARKNKAKTTTNADDASSSVIPSASGGDASTEPKRGPGRPRKNKIVVNKFEVEGIKNVPKTPGNVMEFVYDSPALFKTLFTFLKNNSIIEVNLIFEKDCVQIAQVEHLNKSVVCFHYDCTNALYYYVEERCEIGINREDVQKIFERLTETYYYVGFYLRRVDAKSALNICMCDGRVDTIESHEIKHIDITDKVDPLPLDIGDDYPISFKLPADVFKKKFTVPKHIRMVSFEKYGESPLCIRFGPERGFSIDFKKPETIQLKSKVAANDLFNVAVKLTYISSFIKTQLGEEVNICVSRDKPIIFKACMGACTIIMSTEIMDTDRAI